MLLLLSLDVCGYWVRIVCVVYVYSMGIGQWTSGGESIVPSILLIPIAIKILNRVLA